jgi:hypothetical protein
MNKIILLFSFTFLSLVVLAQTPQAFNYQAVARDNAGMPIPNKVVNIRISILQGSATGTPVYTETFNLSTNKLGLFNLQMGTGTVQSGTFANINWGSSTYFSRVEIDPAGGTNFTVLGTSPMLSVPYALYAKKVETESQSLSLSGNTLSISSGNSVVLPSATLQAGTGIAINGNTITNTAPGVTYTAGAGISINNNVITNNAPNQTVSLTGSNGVNVTGTYPNFAISGSSSSSGQIIVMNTANATTLTLTAPSLIQVGGTITLSTDNSRLATSNNNQIFGGTFQGSGSQVLYASINNKFYGVTFSNISVEVNASDGNREFNNNAIFENCTFTGTINKLPSQALFVNCTFTNAMIGNANYLGRFVKCNITGTTIPILVGITQSTLNNSTIGTNGSYGQIEFLTDNFIYSGNQIYLFDDCRVIGNQISNSKLQVGGVGVNSNTPRTLSISNNFFDVGDPNFTDAMITFDLSSSIRAKSYVISNNQFLITNSSVNLNAIKIQNNDGSTLVDSKILITGNLFNRSSLAAIVNNSTNARLIVVNNITNSVSLGVTDNGTLVRLANNFSF